MNVRTWLIPLALGCGSEPKVKDDASTTPSDSSPPDAPSFVKCSEPIRGTNVYFREIGTVSGAALLVTAPSNDPRLFVVERNGAIRIFEDELLLPTPFLDLSATAGGPVLAGGERGLLGLAFHPSYASNGQLFVFYTTQTANIVARCLRDAGDPNRADPASCVTVLSIPDTRSNHNGGMIEFGADGMLYIGTGDGGGSGDPDRNGQSLVDGSPLPQSVALLGKMLRIDVDNKAPGKEYGIPSDNPFAQGGGAPEIFQIGLRNPWRWSFDRGTGDMWIADVGQNVIEEVNVVKSGEQAGVNFGWNDYEGSRCFRQGCAPQGKFFPQDERTQAEGWNAIIGGQVYRGGCFPDLVGTYFYADHGGRKYATATLNPNGSLTVTDLSPAPGEDPFPANPASIHSDGLGELHLTTTAGAVFRIEARP
jgi:glucose/arabinose dehydrogenase